LDIAIVGAGLAGLSAADQLVRRLPSSNVVVLEKEPRIGGRVLSSYRPEGEHGAEFVLQSEESVLGLLKMIGVRKGPPLGYGACRFQNVSAEGSVGQMARTVLSPESFKLIAAVLKVARKPNNNSGLAVEATKPWGKDKVSDDPHARAFLEMLLAGETCSPWAHMTVSGILGGLDESDIYRVVGGTERIVHALRSAASRAKVMTGARVVSLETQGRAVVVSWLQGGRLHEMPFDAAIVASPDGSRLLKGRNFNRGPKFHFHPYLSVLLEYPQRWWAKALPALAQGLYTDQDLNFIEEVPTQRQGRHVLRILQPNAREWLNLTDSEIEARCILALCRLATHDVSAGARKPTHVSIKRWPHGLPCVRDSEQLFHLACRRPPVLLAGDRFYAWPSMDGAIKSGRAAATRLVKMG
jgi:monoamine oxidase